jgi:hypothetical protein
VRRVFYFSVKEKRFSSKNKITLNPQNSKDFPNFSLITDRDLFLYVGKKLASIISSYQCNFISVGHMGRRPKKDFLKENTQRAIVFCHLVYLNKLSHHACTSNTPLFVEGEFDKRNVLIFSFKFWILQSKRRWWGQQTSPWGRLESNHRDIISICRR